jgi:hypothetical protein
VAGGHASSSTLSRVVTSETGKAISTSSFDRWISCTLYDAGSGWHWRLWCFCGGCIRHDILCNASFTYRVYVSYDENNPYATIGMYSMREHPLICQYSAARRAICHVCSCVLLIHASANAYPHRLVLPSTWARIRSIDVSWQVGKDGKHWALLYFAFSAMLYPSLIIIIQEDAEHAESRAFSANRKALDELQTSPSGCFAITSMRKEVWSVLVRFQDLRRSRTIITRNDAHDWNKIASSKSSISVFILRRDVVSAVGQ